MQDNIYEAKIKDVDFMCGVIDNPDQPFEGGCGKPIPILEAYKCAECTAYFHRDCALKHFEEPTMEEQLKSLEEWEGDVRPLASEGNGDMLVGIVYRLLQNKDNVLKNEK